MNNTPVRNKIMGGKTLSSAFSLLPSHLTVTLLLVLTPLVLYAFRRLDDNRLTSWDWVFTTADPLLLFAVWVLTAAGLHLAARRIAFKNRFILLIPVSFAAGALFWPAPEVIVDASRYFSQARHLSEYGPLFFLREWGREIFAWTDLPLMPFIYGMMFTLAGESREWGQILNSTLFSLSVYLTALLGRNLWDEDTGYNAGLLLLGFPFLYTQIPLFMVDTGTMFLLVLFLFVLHQFLIRGGFFYGVLVSLSVFALFWVKYSAWLFMTVAIPLLLFSPGRPTPGNSLMRLIVPVLPSLAGIALILWLHLDSITAQMELLWSYQTPGLERWGESLLSTFFFQTHPLLTLAALFSLWRAWQKRDPRYLIIIWLFVLVLIFLEVRRIRYTLPLFPLAALAAAYGLQALADFRLRRHLVLGIALSSLLLAWGAFLPFMQALDRENLDRAGSFLDSLNTDHAVVTVLTRQEWETDQRVFVPMLDMFTEIDLMYLPPPVSPGPPDGVDVSPLRFTWEYPLPRFYQKPVPAGDWPVLVIISDVPDPDLPGCIREKLPDKTSRKHFSRKSPVFSSKMKITIYHSPEKSK